MTSINVIRFSEHAGAMVCDEQRHWNEERMKSLTTEKIRSVVEDSITQKLGLVAAYGNTGTSTIGEEFRNAIRHNVSKRYAEAVDEAGDQPGTFLSMFDLAKLVFRTQTEIKHRHIDEQLQGRYGFTTRDFCRGFYFKDEEKVPIKSKDVVKKVEEMITWKGRGKDTRAVFGNSGLLAGYSPEDGFQIFHFSLAHHFWRPISAPFLALGSGSDAADIAFLNWARDLSLQQRRGGIDPVEGTMAAVTAVNEARKNNLGVDGYFKIVLIDGSRPKDRYREISDHRSKLLMETAQGAQAGIITRRHALEIFEGMCFGGLAFEGALKLLWKNVTRPARLDRFRRGYRV